MPAPYDYTIGEIASPQQSFLQGIQMVDALRKREQAMAEAQAAQKKQQELQALYAEAMKPDAKPDVFERLSFAIDPQKAVQDKFAQRSAAQQDAMIRNVGSVWAPLLTGNPELAMKQADMLIAATENSPNVDQKSLQSLKDARQALGQSPDLAQVSLATTLMSFGDKGRTFVTDTFEALKKPVEQRKAAADAGKAESEQGIKAIELKFAPDKFAADLGLTQTQIDQAKAAKQASEAAANASGAAARRANAEAEQMTAGIIPAEKRPEAEGKFRKEYSDQTKGYQEVKSAYGRVLASEDTAVGDLSLIFGYMKMLDPGSVVREGEFATAQNAAGVPERIKNIYNQVASGQRLSPSQRTAFKGQAGKLYSTAKTQEATVRSGIERIARGYGLNTANIFYEEAETPPTELSAPKPATPQPAVPSQAVPAPASKRNIRVDY
jgi:hypothetical protein